MKWWTPSPVAMLVKSPDFSRKSFMIGLEPMPTSRHSVQPIVNSSRPSARLL